MSPRRRRTPWWQDRPADAGHRPPAARGAGSRRGFGRTWWGKAWVEALEQRAALDPNRLPRGRGYARRGTVAALHVEPGAVRTTVQGTRAKPYDVTVRVRQFDTAEWDRVLSAVAASVGRLAALLDAELPPEVVGDVSAAGLSLLPGAGEVQPRCSCPDVADPCKHSAAVCYLVAELLDEDPFALLAIRGRTRDEVLAELRRRRGGAPAADSDDAPPRALGAPDADLGMPARDAYAREVSPTPAVPRLAPRAGRPAAAALAPPVESGVDRDALVALASDAARRAWELAAGDGDGALTLTTEQDVARRAVALLGTDDLGALARRVGTPSRQLVGHALAWRAGGAGGLAALLQSWKPDPADIWEGREALGAPAAGAGPLRVRGNRLTRGSVQLRLGQDGLWYRFRRSLGSWDLVGAPAADPRALLEQDG